MSSASMRMTFTGLRTKTPTTSVQHKTTRALPLRLCIHAINHQQHETQELCLLTSGVHELSPYYMAHLPPKGPPSPLQLRHNGTQHHTRTTKPGVPTLLCSPRRAWRLLGHLVPTDPSLHVWLSAVRTLLHSGIGIPAGRVTRHDLLPPLPIRLSLTSANLWFSSSDPAWPSSPPGWSR
jgi:hypothetical protein